MTDEFVELVSTRYRELFEHITGKTFDPAPLEGAKERIQRNVESYLSKRA